MHSHAQPYLDAVADPQIREKLRVFFDAFDSMDRENSHLRLVVQRDHPDHCPYGHFKADGCELGYPGCACMDDLMALTAWSPEDEEKAAVRLGRLLLATRKALTSLREAATLAADTLEHRGAPTTAAALRTAASAHVGVSL